MFLGLLFLLMPLWIAVGDAAVWTCERVTAAPGLVQPARLELALPPRRA